LRHSFANGKRSGLIWIPGPSESWDERNAYRQGFSLLLALRRSGPSYELRPTDMYKQSLLSSGAITNRIDKVEKEGWVKRFDSPGDRRGVVVRLTASGKAMADKAVEIHFAQLAAQLSKLAKKDRQLLLELLRRLLRTLEEEDE
jgi:DNA-binding MarR family transcriptional regulator